MDSIAAWFRDTLSPWGEPGILVLAALDASFVPMPQIIDLAVMLACALEPPRAPTLALAAIVGSTAGTMVLYSIARGGRKVGGVGSRRLAWAEGFLARRGTTALVIAALLPAPFPFKAIVVAAGYLRQPIGSTVLGVAVGRSFRFGSQALLAALYGDAIIAQVEEHAPLAGLALAVFVLLVAVIYYRWRGSLPAAGSPARPPTEPPGRPPADRPPDRRPPA